MCLGGILALRPARVPGQTFRASTDVLPWLGLGLLLIALGAVALHHRQQQRTRPGLWAARGVIFGALLYASGHTLRQFLSGAWEPAVPVGFLSTIVSLIVLGVSTLRVRAIPHWTGWVLIASGICLLAFNDQYQSAWAAVPFGLLWILLGAFLARSGTGTSPAMSA